ncbi:MAG: barstar family protein [Archangium sp.]|nr:barstar family protein [Archangium sp.]MDP3571703.1 barstar family protein [Archangium sp.]
MPLIEPAFVARVPGGVSDKGQLMSLLKDALDFPNYFGRNWDALSDCLCDLSWLAAGPVMLIHDELPQLSEKELRIYVDILASASARPRKTSHELSVVFAERDRKVVAGLLPPCTLIQ